MKLTAKMNKIFIAILAVSVFTACMKDGPAYQMSGVFSDSYEYLNSDDIFKGDADYFLFYEIKDQSGTVTDPTGILPVNYIEYYNKHMETNLFGGFVLSRQVWQRPESQEKPETEKPKAEGGQEQEQKAPGIYSVYGKSGANNSKTFLFFLDNGRETRAKHDISFKAGNVGTFTVTGANINNSAATILAITGESGTEFNLTGDYTLTATGYLNGKKTASADFLLAGKGRGKVAGTDSLVTSWKPFDLSKLGSIEHIDFTLSTPAGVTMQRTFCMDDFTGNVSISY